MSQLPDQPQQQDGDPEGDFSFDDFLTNEDDVNAETPSADSQNVTVDPAQSASSNSMDEVIKEAGPPAGFGPDPLDEEMPGDENTSLDEMDFNEDQSLMSGPQDGMKADFATYSEQATGVANSGAPIDSGLGDAAEIPQTAPQESFAQQPFPQGAETAYGMPGVDGTDANPFAADANHMASDADVSRVDDLLAQQGFDQTAPGRQADPDDPFAEDVAEKKKWPAWLGIVAIGLFGAAIYFAYDYGIKNDSFQDAPIVKAPTEPIRVLPTEKDGRQINNTDIAVYNNLQSDKANDPKAGMVDILQPKPEQPITPPGWENKTAAGQQSGTKPLSPLQEIPAKEASAAGKNQTAGRVTQQPAPKAVAKPAPKPKPVAKPKPKPKPKPKASPKPASNGRFWVQIASLKSQKAAETAWQNLSGKHQSLLGKYRSDIQRADLKDRGIFYRLRVGPLSTRDDSAQLCTQLQMQKIDCLVVAK